MAMKRLVNPDSKDFKEKRKQMRAKKAIEQMSWFSDKTPAQIRNYVDSNVTDIATAKDFLKKLAVTLHNIANYVGIKEVE